MNEIEPREAWIDFFLKCEHEIDSTFKRGNPKMKYLPIQTSNGRRNPVSLWQEPEAVKINFIIERNSDLEARLTAFGLHYFYEETRKHLRTILMVSPESREAVLLREIARAAFQRALPTQAVSRRKAKDGLSKMRTVETVR